MEGEPRKTPFKIEKTYTAKQVLLKFELDIIRTLFDNFEDLYQGHSISASVKHKHQHPCRVCWKGSDHLVRTNLDSLHGDLQIKKLMDERWGCWGVMHTSGPQ